MDRSDLTANHALSESLACIALNPGLRSLLVFDAPYAGLQSLAAMLAQLLKVTTERQVMVAQLASFESDDEVWGSIALPGKPLLLRLFSPQRAAREFQLITLPDLAALSQAAARTCTMLIGAEVVHLERHEQHEVWQPHYCWLATCKRADVGRISPHLLDRFALRIQWSDIDPAGHLSYAERVADLQAHVPRDLPAVSEIMPPEILHRLAAAGSQLVEITLDALAHVMRYSAHTQVHPRRDIALARFAHTLAQLAGSPTLDIEHVEEAARLLGLNLQGDEMPEDGSAPLEDPAVSIYRSEPEEPSSAPLEPSVQQISDTAQSRQIELPETLSESDPTSGTLCSDDPYPEDSAFVAREAASLQLPAARSSRSRSLRGPIIGVEQGDTLTDLAITSTIIHALKFQRLRRTSEQARLGKIIFKLTDLRRYRRGATLEHLLLLLLDYTSVRDRPDWQEALSPYLNQAYTERASVVVIKVGAEDAASELQAELISARNVTLPAVEEALETGSGRASPLAHGLMLAGDRLRHALQHGRSRVREATLLVFSDGRGNVPRAASLKNCLQGLVGQEGVTDALREAARLSALQRVESIVFNPQPSYYPELPVLLAQALGARIELLPDLDERAETEEAP